MLLQPLAAHERDTRGDAGLLRYLLYRTCVSRENESMQAANGDEFRIQTNYTHFHYRLSHVVHNMTYLKSSDLASWPTTL